MFQLTPQAAAQIRSAALASGATTMALRVAAKHNADGEVVYTMGFDEASEGDSELSAEGVRILISKRCAALLEDVELDYVELTAGTFNFIFVPRSNAATSRPAGGCGGGGCGGGCSNQGNA